MSEQNGIRANRLVRVSALAFGVCVALSGSVVTAKAPSAPLIEYKWQNEAPIAENRGIFIVGLPEAPLASYRGELAEYAPPPRNAEGRLELDSAAANAYLDFLQTRHEQVLQDAQTLLGRQVESVYSLKHAFNGMVLRISNTEAVELKSAGLISFIEPYKEYQLATDIGPELIGSPGVWDGTAPGLTASTRGEGVVVGIIDSGINQNHPSFSATDSDGYTHTNPLGSGNFIGWCNSGVGTVTDTCNDKLIGGWDFVSPFVPDDGTEIPGMEDENGHGSHTAGTTAGNVMESNFGDGANPMVSGVAPRANIVVYDACYTSAAGQGLCPNAATLASINQVVADGVVDVINYSIGGGTQPWTQSISLAFLNAVDAGVFVSASAGNSGPGPQTMGHLQPWVSSVAASTHGRFFADASVDVSGGDSFGAVSGSGPELTTAIDRDLVLDTNLLGCDPFDPDTFVDSIAFVLRGSCSFAQKIDNASDAGALAVVIGNNSDTTPFGPGGTESTTVPAVMVSQAAAQQLIDEITASGTGRLDIVLDVRSPAVAVSDASLADIVADFSSRGPNPFDTIKPSVAAPGVSILAAVEAGGGADGAPAFRLLQGTSMASPHNAGAAALLRALRPTWTPSEIQSALMLTANRDMRADSGAGIVNSTVFDRGAGRIDVSRAAATPLIMRETPLNFFSANPDAGGEPSTLNLAGLSNGFCLIDCVFEREFQSVADAPKQFNVRFAGDSGMSATVNPSRFTIQPRQRVSVEINVEPNQGALDQWQFGEIILTEEPVGTSLDTIFRDRFEAADGSATSTLAMPVSVFAVEPFPIADVDQSVSATATSGGSGSGTFEIGNVGTAVLDWSFSSFTRIRAETFLAQGDTTGNAIVSGFFTVSPENTGAYTAEAFQVSEDTSIGGMFFEGFSSGGVDLTSLSSEIRFYVYADDSGSPAGNPEDGLDLELWTATLAVGSPGLTIEGSDIDLNLSEAGLPDLDLTAGQYWLSVAPVVASSGQRWNWLDATSGPGVAVAQLITPGAAFGGAFPDWTPLTAIGAGSNYSFALDGAIECGASWLSIDPTTGSVAPGGAPQSVAVNIDASSLAPGEYQGNVCLDTNDPNAGSLAVQVNLTVEP